MWALTYCFFLASGVVEGPGWYLAFLSLCCPFLGVPLECFVGRQRLSSSKVMGSLAGEADAGLKRDCLPSGDRGSR